MKTAASSSRIDLDTVFEVLSDHRRRYVLYVLYRAEGGAMTVDRLVTRVSRMEGDDRNLGGEPSPERIADDLRERQLPKLLDAGVVEYDDRSETVRYYGRPAFEEWLEHAAYKEGRHPEC